MIVTHDMTTGPTTLGSEEEPHLEVARRDDLRRAFRRLANGVMIVSSLGADGPQAVCVTAVIPVSFDPPSLLACINRGASIHDTLASGCAWWVNMLRRDHEALARRCAGAAKGAERFVSGDWRLDECGLPHLVTALAAVRCRLAAQLNFGSHSIFVGRVDRVVLGGEIDPLIYVDGAYRQLANSGSTDDAQ